MVTVDPLAVRAVIAVSGIPTVFFMLLGGSLVDRFFPLPIMKASNVTRIVLAFACMGLPFIFSSLLLVWIRLKRQKGDSTDRADEDAGILRTIGEGIRFVRADSAMFTMFLLNSGVELLVECSVIVGIPILAGTKMAEGAGDGSNRAFVRWSGATRLDTSRDTARTQTRPRTAPRFSLYIVRSVVDTIRFSEDDVEGSRRGAHCRRS